MRFRTSFKHLLLAALVASVAALAIPSMAGAASANDAFYKYTGSTPLADIAPGTPLKTRNIQYHILGLATPLRTTQILYRTTDARQRPTVNVTSVIQPTCFLCLNREKVISYQSFYDSLNPEDQPSVQIAGGLSLTGIIPQIETVLFAPFLLQGYSIVVSDTQGQTADFAAGPEYGTNTLDSIRTAIKAPQIDLSSNAKVALIGYSGGAIATEWAAELAPTYAPDLNKNLIGAAYGGVLVDPDHNLPYVGGSSIWAGVAPMALIGVARAYGIDLQPYVNDYGKTLLTKLDKASIVNVLAQYSGLKWTDYVKPQYADPHSIQAYVEAANIVIMGTGGTPKIPMFVGQGTGGELEGTPASATYGKGDGVMLAGDVRGLLRGYCSKGVKVKYNEYGGSHVTSALVWLPQAIGWTFARFGIFGSSTVPNNCSSIKPGNSLAPAVYTP
ncbi:MAG: lipase family protein [Solirubrobacterales bacterium]